MPIKILVNRQSASASEVLSGCLRDYGLAELVGETTFGKGIVQSVIELDEGDAVKLTVSQYYTPSGFGLHGVGLPADVELPKPMPSEAGVITAPADDPWVQSALDFFDRQPVLEPLFTEKSTGIAPPQSLTEALPDGFSCKEKHLKLGEQDLTSLLATFTQSANRQIKLRVDNWFIQEGELGQPPFSHDLTYQFWTDTPEETAFITFSYDLDGESLHAVECVMLDPIQSVEFVALVLELVGEPLPENGREAILDALEQGTPYKLKGKHSDLELREYDGNGGFYLLITAS